MNEPNEITAIEFGCAACASKTTVLGPRSSCKAKSQTFIVGVHLKQLQTHFVRVLGAFLYFSVTGPRMHWITGGTFCVLSGRISLSRNVHIAVFFNLAGGDAGI